MVYASGLGDSFRSFFDAIDKFFSNLAAVNWGPLLLALLCYGTYLTIRSRASYHVLRAAYPAERFRWREIWGAFLAGFGVNADRRRYFREVYFVQLGAWLFRCGTYYFMLDAFHVGGSVHNVLLVLGVMSVSAVVPFTPGGAGVQQALLVEVFGKTAGAATVAAYSVG